MGVFSITVMSRPGSTLVETAQMTSFQSLRVDVGVDDDDELCIHELAQDTTTPPS